MVMSPEKYMLLRAKVLEVNSKSLEVDGARYRAAARAPLIAACLQDRPVQAAIPREGAKRLFFSDGAQDRRGDRGSR